VFAGRLPRDPTLYLSTSCVTATEEAPDGCENVFVLANAPAGAAPAAVQRFADDIIERLGVRDRLVVRGVRGPAELAHETGALGGAIYGAAPHGRLATLRRPGPEVRGVRGLYRVGGTAHPGGGLPLVMLSGALVARLIGRAGGA
jgi:phytoene dehydrogenase-like protein